MARIGNAFSVWRGRRAEQAARRYLEDHGLRFVDSNYRGAGGEIDLIMWDGDELVFVEVRARGRTTYAGAAESIDTLKQRRLVSCARHYLATCRGEPNCRFDVVAMTLKPSAGESAVDWIRDAFGA